MKQNLILLGMMFFYAIQCVTINAKGKLKKTVSIAVTLLIDHPSY